MGKFAVEKDAFGKEKVALFAFNGDPMCFIHVLINAQDFVKNGFETTVVIEGSAVKLVSMLNEGRGLEEFRSAKPDMYKMIQDNFIQVRDAGLISCVCRACARQTGMSDQVEPAGLRFCGELKGHPSMARFTAEGYRIITF